MLCVDGSPSADARKLRLCALFSSACSVLRTARFSAGVAAPCTSVRAEDRRAVRTARARDTCAGAGAYIPATPALLLRLRPCRRRSRHGGVAARFRHSSAGGVRRRRLQGWRARPRRRRRRLQESPRRPCSCAAAPGPLFPCLAARAPSRLRSCSCTSRRSSAACTCVLIPVPAPVLPLRDCALAPRCPATSAAPRCPVLLLRDSVHARCTGQREAGAALLACASAAPGTFACARAAASCATVCLHCPALHMRCSALPRAAKRLCPCALHRARSSACRGCASAAPCTFACARAAFSA